LTEPRLKLHTSQESVQKQHFSYCSQSEISGSGGFQNAHDPGRRTSLSMMMLLLFMILSLRTGQASPLSFEKPTIDGVQVNIIRADLKDPSLSVTPAFAPGYQESTENYPAISLEDMMELYNPAAAINGPFFDMESGRVVCATSKDSSLLSDGELGSSLLMDTKGILHLHLTAGLRSRKMEWGAVSWGVRCGPTLIYNGKPFYHPLIEGFTSSSLYRPTRRSAMAVTEKGELLLVTVSQNITMERFLHVMGGTGARHAINLDGGSSTAMAYEGRAVVSPSRALPCYILIYHRKEDAPFLGCRDIRKYLERRASIRGRAMYLNAYTSFEERRYSEALEQILKACELDENSVTDFDLAARCCENLGKLKEAAHMHIRCALLLLRRGGRDEARAHIEKALADNPESSEALDARNIIDNSPGISSGLLSLLSGDGKGALKALDSMLKQGVKNPMIMTLLAGHFRSAGQNTKAAECLKAAALLYMKREAFFQGYLAAKEAAELEPESPEYRELLSGAARCRGDEKTSELQRLIFQALQNECEHVTIPEKADPACR